MTSNDNSQSTNFPATVLVTGGSGFLAGWCIAELLRRGFQVRTTLRDLRRELKVRAALSSVVESTDRLNFFEADLMQDDGWAAAVTNCDYVLHVASPFPSAPPKDADELIIPAREGTLRVLRAALQTGVRRVVLTSSLAAVGYGPENPSLQRNETHWTDVSTRLGRRAYVQSKTLAERAAWSYVEEQGARERLTVVAPGLILGPVFGNHLSYSVQTIDKLLKGEMPGLPRLGFSIVDVRDVADLHLKAMTAPQAAGERYLGTGDFLWLADVARILRDELGARAAKVPRRKIPNLLVRAIALFDPSVRQVVGELDQRIIYSAEKAKETLGWRPRPIVETTVDCANSLLRPVKIAT